MSKPKPIPKKCEKCEDFAILWERFCKACKRILREKAYAEGKIRLLSECSTTFNDSRGRKVGRSSEFWGGVPKTGNDE